MGDFFERDACSWEQLLEIRKELCLGDGWIFRGQASDCPLTTTLERAREDLGVKWCELPGAEDQMIREFRRQYDGIDRHLVERDTLYCLALVRHHGGPARLLDCSYSFYVGAYFALESAPQPYSGIGQASSVPWCISDKWCERQSKCIVGERPFLARQVDATRTGETFRLLYMSECRRRFVMPENAISLNRRLVIQQGIFLCPGDVSAPFESNLRNMDGFSESDAIVKVRLNMNQKCRANALDELHRMNITRASLFPGLDGFAQSLRTRLPFFARQAARSVGQR